MWNARLDEAQAGIKIAQRNINSLRYADDTTLMAESEGELKSFLMKVKGQDRKKDTDVYNGLLDSEGEGEGGMIWENGNSNLYTVM